MVAPLETSPPYTASPPSERVGKWRDEEKQYLEYENGVNFTTEWNTPMDRLRRIEKAEETFKRIGIPYSIYNRGLYLELKEELDKLNQKQNLI